MYKPWAMAGHLNRMPILTAFGLIFSEFFRIIFKTALFRKNVTLTCLRCRKIRTIRVFDVSEVIELFFFTFVKKKLTTNFWSILYLLLRNFVQFSKNRSQKWNWGNIFRKMILLNKKKEISIQKLNRTLIFQYKCLQKWRFSNLEQNNHWINFIAKNLGLKYKKSFYLIFQNNCQKAPEATYPAELIQA